MSNSIIVLHPGRLSGKPTINESRIPADLVADLYWNYGADEIFAQWDYLTREDILVCCWYVGHHGSRRDKARFRSWLEHADHMLWSDETIPDCEWPPRKEGEK